MCGLKLTSEYIGLKGHGFLYRTSSISTLTVGLANDGLRKLDET